MILKAGTYRFNDVLTITDSHNMTYLNFTYNGVQCNEINVGYTDGEVSDGSDILLYDRYSSLEFYGLNGDYYLIYANGSISQNNEILVQGTGYKVDTPVDIIITADIEVDDAFGECFIANTDYNEINPPATPLATIEYNGETIAQLNAGETCTLKCAGLPMETDIIIKINEVN